MTSTGLVLPASTTILKINTACDDGSEPHTWIYDIKQHAKILTVLIIMASRLQLNITSHLDIKLNTWTWTMDAIAFHSTKVSYLEAIITSRQQYNKFISVLVSFLERTCGFIINWNQSDYSSTNSTVYQLISWSWWIIRSSQDRATLCIIQLVLPLLLSNRLPPNASALQKHYNGLVFLCLNQST